VLREDHLLLEETAEVFYPLLEKGEYKVKVIFDLDGNGKWTTGDFESKRQPEPVSYYPAVIEVKVQWDLEQEWDLTDFNFKTDQMRNVIKPSGR
jgi:hypothetical protein